MTTGCKQQKWQHFGCSVPKGVYSKPACHSVSVTSHQGGHCEFKPSSCRLFLWPYLECSASNLLIIVSCPRAAAFFLHIVNLAAVVYVI